MQQQLSSSRQVVKPVSAVVQGLNPAFLMQTQEQLDILPQQKVGMLLRSATGNKRVQQADPALNEGYGDTRAGFA